MEGVRTNGPVITAWSAVSPFGIGAAPFRAGLRAGRPAVDAEVPGGPENERARLVPGFDAREVLGRKGTRSMDRVTALALTAVGRVLGPDAGGTTAADGSPRPGTGPFPDATSLGSKPTGLVLGTTTGSPQSIMDFTRDSITGERPYLVDPARFPNTVMNCAAGRSAIRYGLRGPNATIAGGRSAGLLALKYAHRLQRNDRADTVLCGGAEEYMPVRGWLHHHSRRTGSDGAAAVPGSGGPVLGEGCAVLRLDPAGTLPDGTGLAEVAALEFGVVTGTLGIREVLASCLRRALSRTPFTADSVWAVAPCQAPGAAGVAERDALAEVLGTASPLRLACSDLIGDTAAAAATFQIAAVLAVAHSSPAAVDRAALVTSVDQDGTVGCAVLRLLPGAASHGRDTAA